MQGQSLVHSGNRKSIPGKIIQLAGKHCVCVCLSAGGLPTQDETVH